MRRRGWGFVTANAASLLLPRGLRTVCCRLGLLLCFGCLCHAKYDFQLCLIGWWLLLDARTFVLCLPWVCAGAALRLHLGWTCTALLCCRLARCCAMSQTTSRLRSSSEDCVDLGVMHSILLLCIIPSCSTAVSTLLWLLCLTSSICCVMRSQTCKSMMLALPCLSCGATQVMLDVCGRKWRTYKLPLQTVRPFVYSQVRCVIAGDIDEPRPSALDALGYPTAHQRGRTTVDTLVCLLFCCSHERPPNLHPQLLHHKPCSTILQRVKA